MKPNLRLVEAPPQPVHGDYRDHLYRKDRKSGDWRIETTRKASGDFVMTGTGFTRQP